MSESEWVSSVSKHSLPQHMPSSRTRAEKYQGKGQKWKETEWFSFPLALYMKNVRSKKHLLPPMYLSAHFQEAWPHPGHRLAREQSLTQHIRKHRSPRLGGLLLFLWLNSQAGRAGTAPNDSWVLQSHTGPHRQASAPSPLPLLTAELGYFATFSCSLTAVTTKGYFCVCRGLQL